MHFNDDLELMSSLLWVSTVKFIALLTIFFHFDLDGTIPRHSVSKERKGVLWRFGVVLGFLGWFGTEKREHERWTNSHSKNNRKQSKCLKRTSGFKKKATVGSDLGIYLNLE